MTASLMMPRTATDAESDRGIVERVVAGDVNAYELLVRRYLRVVQGFVAGRYGLAGDNLDEAVQASLIAAYEGLPKLRDPDRFAGYLLTIAGRTAQRRTRMSVPLDSDAIAQESIESCHDDLQVAISRLPPAWQQLLAMKYGEELTAEQIAARLKRPVGSITKDLSRAYAKLREDARLKASYES